MKNNSENMEKFLETKLSTFLGFEIPKEMIDHIMSLSSESAVRIYFDGLLDKTDKRHSQFINEFINKRNLKNPNFKQNKNNRKKTMKPPQQQQQSQESELYEFKSNFDQLEKQYQVNNNKHSNLQKDKNLSKSSSKFDCTNENSESDLDYLKKLATKYETPYEKYKKVTFSPLEFNTGERYPLLPGRRFCGCLAKRHNLVNNCLNCGRLQCEQEGSGPCMFCGNLVVSNEERLIIDNEGAEADELITKLLSQPKPDGWEKAVENQQRLRNFDLSKKERQKVIDDQSDYFTLSYSNWTNNSDELSCVAKKLDQNAERENLIKSQTTTKLSVISQNDKSKMERKNRVNPLKNLKNNEIQVPKNGKGIRFDDEWRLSMARQIDMVCAVATLDKEVEEFLETLEELKRPELREKLFYQDPRTINYLSLSKNDESTAQDYDWENEFWELNDYFDRLGFAISIRQPYASLIMAGIKKHEGRSWSTDLRGIIWIVSAAKEPTKEEIESVENFYRKKYEGKNLVFPKKYPTGRLLGRAQITSCLDRDEYLETYPDGEVDSDYVFVFGEVIPLPIIFPLKGHSGIYLLPKKLHTAAGILIRKLIREKPYLLDSD